MGSKQVCVCFRFSGTVAPVDFGKRKILAKRPVNPTILSFLEVHTVKSQGIVQEWFAKSQQR